MIYSSSWSVRRVKVLQMHPRWVQTARKYHGLICSSTRHHVRNSNFELDSSSSSSSFSSYGVRQSVSYTDFSLKNDFLKCCVQKIEPNIRNSQFLIWCRVLLVLLGVSKLSRDDHHGIYGPCSLSKLADPIRHTCNAYLISALWLLCLLSDIVRHDLESW